MRNMSILFIVFAVVSVLLPDDELTIYPSVSIGEKKDNFFSLATSVNEICSDDSLAEPDTAS